MTIQVGRGERAAEAGPALDEDAAAIADELRRRTRAEVRFDRQSRALYATDASNYRQVPIGVVVPRTIDDVVATVEIARRHGAPILARGAGTSLAGQCCNVAIVIDFSKYLNRILEIDPDRKIARVQPGVVLDDLRRETERRYGLTFGPDPATSGWCTLGGMIGNNSCGVHSVMAGRTSDNVEALEVLTYDGTRMRVGRTDDAELESIVRAGGRRAEIYQSLRRIRDDQLERIRTKFPDIPRRVSGFNLDELLPERGFNVARALVGTEGTCVTVLEATLKLVPSPPVRVLVVLGYPDVFAAAEDVPRILPHGPIGLEGIDDRLVGYIREKNLVPGSVERLPEGKGWLLVELGGTTGTEAIDKARALIETVSGPRRSAPDHTGPAATDVRSAPRPSSQVLVDPAAQARLWEVRKSALGATARIPRPDGEGHQHAWEGWEDAAVAPERLGSYLREFYALVDRYGYETSVYGHFGDGCLHCRITFDLESAGGIERYKSFVEEAADAVLRHGGSLSGEHGDGQSRAFLLPRMFGPELVDAFRTFKQAFDPENRMNPGKVIDPAPPDAHLRLGPDHRPWKPETFFAYTDDDGDLAAATLRCVGVGKCRRTRDAFMCPSFLATRDERDSTRGRARVLFEMTKADFLEDGWESEEVLDALSLCLGCKGCKKECPVGVDVARYKEEFLAQHYRDRARPLIHHAMGRFDLWAKLASRLPEVSNFFGQTPPFSTLLKRVAGVAPDRKLPEFARETFTSWIRREQTERMLADPYAIRARGFGRPVLLYADPFHDHFAPEVLRAALDVLKRLHYDVLVAPEAPPGIRPYLHYGMLAEARRSFLRAVDLLEPYARAEIPILALEPSTVAAYRDELVELLPDEPLAAPLARGVRLLSEFLDAEAATRVHLPLRLEAAAGDDGGSRSEGTRRPEDRAGWAQATPSEIAPGFGNVPASTGASDPGARTDVDERSAAGPGTDGRVVEPAGELESRGEAERGAREGGPVRFLPRLPRRVILHGHCHAKAVLDAGAARRLLEKMGAEVAEPEPGCCGMAGSFGYEREHAEVSRAIAAQNLGPAIRRSDPSVLIVADGFSCRAQIEEQTGRKPLHLAQVLALALAGDPGARPLAPEEITAVLDSEKPRMRGDVALVTATAAAIGGIVLSRWLRRS